MKLVKLIKKALQEDHAHKDITSLALSDRLKVDAEIIAKQPGIICGLTIAKQVFQTVDKTLHITVLKNDGDSVCKKSQQEAVMKVSGNARSILAAERTALNFLQHLSGIATLTNQCVQQLGNKKITIRDTRKTLPLLRQLEKYAVRVGGGKNQRKNLADQVLFKDNHWQCLAKSKLSLKTYLEQLRKKLVSDKKLKKNKPLSIQVEAKTLAQVQEALESKPDLILLDGMSVGESMKALKRIAGKTRVEISGGIMRDNIGTYKKLAVDYLSLGILTHSAPALDCSLEIL